MLKKDPELIQSWEEGTAAPTYVQLETLAYRVYKRPLALFFFPEAPDEPDPERSFRTLPEAEIEELAADTRYQIRQARAKQLALLELAGGKNPAPRQLIRDLAASAPSRAATAERVRQYLGIDLGAQKAWKNTVQALKAWRASVEASGVFVFKDSFKQKTVSGFSLYHEEVPLVVINNSTAFSRQIFTLFHELAHLLVRTGGVTKEDEGYIHLLGGEARRIEVFCNRFAGEFLVPEADLRLAIRRFGRDDEAVAQIAGLYKVSREMVLRRMFDMGLVRQQEYRRKAAQWTAEYQASAAQREGGGNYYATHASYLSEKYAQLAFGNYYRGAISLEQLASYLNVSAKSIPGLEQFVLQKLSS